MFSKLYYFLSCIIILFGIIHISFVNCLDSFDSNAVWFIGSGVAIVLAGAVNFVRIKSTVKSVAVLCTITNGLMLILSGISLILIMELQAFIAIGLFLTAFIFSLKRKFIIA